MGEWTPAPFGYFGGKAYLRTAIIPLIDAYPHRTYCEPFGGAGWVLFAKKPSPVEVYNDANKDVVAFFKVVVTEKSAPIFYSFEGVFDADAVDHKG